MAKDWSSFFDTWAKPPSATELDERDRTERQIRDAIQAWPALARRNLRIFVKGSYRSGTNVRRGSDVDIAVELRGHERGRESFVYQQLFAAEGLSKADMGFSDAPPEYQPARQSLKDDCQAALASAFGASNVERHNKCITISEKSTTLPADVVPCVTHRRYDSASRYSEGIKIAPDSGPEIVNWPDQDYENGVAKNTSTSKRYKKAVRGLKALEDLMAENGHPEVASWLVECLVYNVPNSEFSSTTNFGNVVSVLRWLLDQLDATTGRGDWLEVNELKWLFGGSQPWLVADALSFVGAAITYIADN